LLLVVAGWAFAIPEIIAAQKKCQTSECGSS
jgi:hypothetical protein